MPEKTATVLNTGVQDLIFTLNQFSSNLRLIPPTFLKNLNLTTVAATGHSFGGSTAAQVMHNDNCFAGSLNFDGALYEPVVKTGLDRPLIRFAETVFNSDRNSTWTKFWKNSSGFKPLLRFKNSKHVTFTDAPLLLDSANP